MNIADAFDRLLARHRPTAPLRIAGSTPLERLRLMAIDVETTGLDPRRDRIVSIAAIGVDGTEIEPQARFLSTVAPGVPVPAQSTQIHGLTDADLIGAPRFMEVLPQFERAIEGRVLLGHHVAFDLAIIAAEARRCKLPWRPPPSVDTAKLVAYVEPYRRHLDLVDLLRRHGVEPQGRRHEAAADARMAAELYVALARILIGRGDGTFDRIESVHHLRH